MNFRRWITALAVVTLFVGLAAAQTSGGGTALTCNTVAQVTPTIRSEGLTEEVGDIVITCQGGTYVALNTAIPQGNIVISLTAPVTSKAAVGTPRALTRPNTRGALPLCAMAYSMREATYIEEFPHDRTADKMTAFMRLAA